MKKLFRFLSRMVEKKGIWFTIYFLTIGFVFKVMKKAWLGVKSLGWLFGFIAFTISNTIFFSPVIVSSILFYTTRNGWFLGAATSYMTWVMFPTGSSLVYAFVVAVTIPAVKFLKNIIEGRKNEKSYKVLQGKNKSHTNT
jgi:uncharacterized membrane protein